MSPFSGLITSVCLFFCLDFNNPKFSPVCKSLFCLFFCMAFQTKSRLFDFCLSICLFGSPCFYYYSITF